MRRSRNPEPAPFAVVNRPASSGGAQGPARAASNASSHRSEGWHISPTTPTLRIMNPDFPAPSGLPGDVNKPLPPTPIGESSGTPFPPSTPISPTRSGSPTELAYTGTVHFNTPVSPEPRSPASRTLRVMNPDPESPRSESPESAPRRGQPQGYVPNFSLPFGPNNPFRLQPYQPNLPPTPPPAPRPAPYRAGHDPHSPGYMGESSSVPMRRPYTGFRPTGNRIPPPPLSLVIPSPTGLRSIGGLPTPVSAYGSIMRTPERFYPGETVERYARPSAPTPDHPRNNHEAMLQWARQDARIHGVPVPRGTGQIPSPADLGSGPAAHARSRSRGNTLATPPGLDTILERDETPAMRRRKPVPPIGNLVADPLPAAAQRRSPLPRGLRWLDFRSWGKSA